MNHFEEFKKEAEAACWRVTGKTVEEWDTIFANRRASGLRSGKLSHDRIMTEWEAEKIRGYYGLQDGDIERILIKPYNHSVNASICYRGDDGSPALPVVFCDDIDLWQRIRSKGNQGLENAMGTEVVIAIAYRPIADLNNRRFE